MPNWCNNQLVMYKTGVSNEELAQIVSRIEKDGLFSQFLKCPDELTALDLHTWGGEHAQAHEQRRVEMKEKYGYPNEYSWCVDNWGTKWEVREPYFDNIENQELTLEFDTAWSPPTGFYATLVQQGWTVTASYWEPGMVFGGYVTTDDNNELHIDHDDHVVYGSPMYEHLETQGLLVEEDFQCFECNKIKCVCDQEESSNYPVNEE